MPSLAILLLLFAVQAPQPDGTGTVSGCVTDLTGGAIPGATLVAKSETFQQKATTDKAGCFELRELRPGPYRVVAMLPGFQNFTRDRVFVTRGSVTSVDVKLTIAPICDCAHIPPPKTLAEAWNKADAAMHIQILSGEAFLLSGSMFYRHDVRVLRSFRKQTALLPIGPTTSVLEMQFRVGHEPYEPGKELVIFPTWLPRARAFLGLGTTGPDCCNNAQTVFEVKDARISSAPESLKRYVGIRIDTLLEELRTLARQP